MNFLKLSRLLVLLSPCVVLTACSLTRTTTISTYAPKKGEMTEATSSDAASPAPVHTQSQHEAGQPPVVSQHPVVSASHMQGVHLPANHVPVDQAIYHPHQSTNQHVRQVSANEPASLPTNGHSGCSCCGGGSDCGWQAPDIVSPWRDEEFLCDGGDRDHKVIVKDNWDVYGIDQEDTVVHYDTIDGRLEIQESNKVCIYAPRFASVRRVSGMAVHQLNGGLGTLGRGQGPVLTKDSSRVNTAMQQLQPGRNLATAGPDRFIENVKTQGNRDYLAPVNASIGFKLFEDLAVLRDGTLDVNEKPRLAKRMQAAKAWTDNLGLQVILDGDMPSESRGAAKLGGLTVYELPEGKSRLRVIKIADKEVAQVGDEVKFTIRFDNVGDRVIGNVTVIDNLTTRLEYIDKSQQCSLKGRFLTQENDGGSLVLRWEITDPLKVGEGGVIQFKCRVR